MTPTGPLESNAASLDMTPILSTTAQPANSTIVINGAGATFPYPVYSAWTYAYSYVDPLVQINYQGIGSGAGKKAIVANTVDFAGSDSILTDDEYAAGKDLQMYPILAGAVVVIYNLTPGIDYPEGSSPPTLVLDRQTLVAIYSGTITKWNDKQIAAINPDLAAFLPDEPITVVYRSDSSGTTELFTRALASFDAGWSAGASPLVDWPVGKNSQGIGMEGNQGVAAAVINTPNSLGYVELSYAVSNSLKYADMINKAGKIVTANAESLTSAIYDFQISGLNESLTVTIIDGSGAGSWPISGYTYLILHTKSMPDCGKAQKLVEYIRWTLTDPSARDRAIKMGYAVLPDTVQTSVLSKLDEVTCTPNTARDEITKP